MTATQAAPGGQGRGERGGRTALRGGGQRQADLFDFVPVVTWLGVTAVATKGYCAAKLHTHDTGCRAVGGSRKEVTESPPSHLLQLYLPSAAPRRAGPVEGGRDVMMREKVIWHFVCGLAPHIIIIRTKSVKVLPGQ